MSINILRPGLLTTIQDLGRVGFQKYGVIVSGAMDSYALRIGNLLVGNDEGEAAFEITLTGPTIEFEQDILIAITGADLSPTIEKVPVPLYKPVYVRKGSVLQFGPCVSGCRAYMAFGGGFDIEEVMGSRSTYLRAGIGGHKGRALKAGDQLTINTGRPQSTRLIEELSTSSDRPFTTTSWSVATTFLQPVTKENTIRVIPGTHYERFTPESRQAFFDQTFSVTPQSDRMGYRLSGPSLELSEAFEVISEAVALGTIQVPSDGNPIVLLADRQTTGGYPRMAQVVSVDISLMAQLKPGDKVRFKEVTVQEAEQLYLKREHELSGLRAAVTFKL
ncbi:biotin-dependent carboxyltransferase family protein [Alkalihalobacterium chitinilyticum]|uniref:5-oxoprolinase subunit C family protein n=1 Tax=Alkalihalobacterium chitinilyticum TaxID=2980103 RepID=UPI0023B1CD6B|nr:biotin-dependent carboxyltransferase family protein [Alkalihalobacterium chitinilyticum]